MNCRVEGIMTEEQFLSVQNALQQFTYTSLNYTDYEEVIDYEIIENDESSIIIYGYNTEDGKYEFHWACNKVEDLARRLQKRNENEVIKFIPKEWVEDLKEEAFEVHAYWQEYVARNLEIAANYVEPIYVDHSNYMKASDVTFSCLGQSRGFAGQTKEWMKQWIDGSSPAVPDYVSDSAVIAEITDELVGIICVGIYGNDEDKTLWVREVAVKPEYQGRGIARKLIGQAFAYGIARNVKKAFLMADECNENAIHLYKSMGFVRKLDEGQIDMIR